MVDDRDHVNNLQEMKLSAMQILETLKSANADDAMKAMQEYTDMVDRFYQDNEHLMAPTQYVQAKQDFEHFMRLLDLAVHHSSGKV